MSKIQTITGKIEAIGQAEYNKQGTVYAYLRILEEDGNVCMMKSVGVCNTVNSYISPGTQGQFHFVKINKGYLLFAYNNDERKVYDGDEVRAASRGFIPELIQLFFVGVLFAVIYFGLGATIHALMGKNRPWPADFMPVVWFARLVFSALAILLGFSIFKRIGIISAINDENLRTYLREYGFKF